MLTIVSELERQRPNPLGGRPVDPLVTGFEAALEGLVCLENDFEAIERALELEKYARGVILTIERHMLAHVNPRKLEAKLQIAHDFLTSAMEHLDARFNRIKISLREERHAVVAIDRALTIRAKRRHRCKEARACQRGPLS